MSVNSHYCLQCSNDKSITILKKAYWPESVHIHILKLKFLCCVSFCSTWAALKYWSQCGRWTSTHGLRWQGKLGSCSIGSDESGTFDSRCIRLTEVLATIISNYYKWCVGTGLVRVRVVRFWFSWTGHIILIFESLILILDFYRAARHNWPNSKVCRSCDTETVTRALFLPSVFCILSDSLCCFPLPLSLLCACLHTPLHSQPHYWHIINTGRTLI